MRKWLLVGLLAAVPASAQAMDIQTFLAKADALKAKGVMALMSSDLDLLKAEIKTQANALGAEQNAARAAKRPVAFCLPSPLRLDNDEILATFRTIPEAQRPRTPVKEGLRVMFTRKFPCR
jgi:hypothetical protein